jgi:hypothetical protein
MTIRSQLRRLRRRLVAIKYFGNSFTFVGREGRNKDQRPNSFVGARAYYGAGKGMRNKDCRSIGPLQRTLKRRGII